MLVCLPLVAIVAAAGMKSWVENLSWRSLRTIALVAVLVWEIGESARAQQDFIAYFNEMAGQDPSRVLSTSCDLDCGQDLYRLADALRERRVPRFNGLAIGEESIAVLE